MAATANIVLTGSITGLATGNRQIGPITDNSVAANGNVQEVQALVAGTTVTLPTVGATTSGVIINLPSGNVNQLIFKGVGADTGVTFGPTGFLCINWVAGSGPASFVLTALVATISAIEVICY